ncbi:hypothetical protein PYCC9005_002277 [Savitreella phatthalungensis]
MPLVATAGILWAGAAIGGGVTAVRVLQAIAAKAAGGTSFPQPLHESIKQWWTCDPVKCERELLQKHCAFTKVITPLDEAGRNFINEVVIEGAPGTTEHVVVLHGFGSGVGFFAPVYRPLSRYGTIHALDWLGMGNSSRLPFSKVAYAALATEEERCRFAEDYFIDSLEAWREARGIDEMRIVAHSFGAYLATRYVTKYAGRCSKIVLVSPVGVNENPYPQGKGNPLPWFIKYMWDACMTPFDFVRWAGPLGPKLCSAWQKTQHDRELREYAYSIFAGVGASERALSLILAPGAHARMPLIDAMPVDLPTTLIYGEHDWMPIDAGIEAARRANKLGGQCDVHVIADAGHHAYMEQTPSFLSAIARSWRPAIIQPS